MTEFDQQKLDELKKDMCRDDLDDIRDVENAGSKLLESMSEIDLRLDLWNSCLMAICRRMHDECVGHMKNPITFEQYLVRYAIQSERVLKSCNG